MMKRLAWKWYTGWSKRLSCSWPRVYHSRLDGLVHVQLYVTLITKARGTLVLWLTCKGVRMNFLPECSSCLLKGLCPCA